MKRKSADEKFFSALERIPQRQSEVLGIFAIIFTIIFLPLFAFIYFYACYKDKVMYRD